MIENFVIPCRRPGATKSSGKKHEVSKISSIFHDYDTFSRNVSSILHFVMQSLLKLPKFFYPMKQRPTISVKKGRSKQKNTVNGIQCVYLCVFHGLNQYRYPHCHAKQSNLKCCKFSH